MSSVRLFIASVGNPAPYYNTLHSAGHHLVDAIQSTLTYPPFRSNLSSGPRHTLFRSPSMMNVSGPPIVKAYRSFVSSLPASERANARLVVVHDEMELPLGQVKVREEGSLRGHNGLKSVKTSLGGAQFARLGVGIGRPDARSSEAVSNYVLKKMTPGEKEKVISKAGLAVMLLEKLQGGG